MNFLDESGPLRPLNGFSLYLYGTPRPNEFPVLYRELILVECLQCATALIYHLLRLKLHSDSSEKPKSQKRLSSLYESTVDGRAQM